MILKFLLSTQDPALSTFSLGAKRSAFVPLSTQHFSVWARWVREKIWHESQKVTKLPDGGMEVAFRVAGLDEIKRWILSFGPEAVVLEPEKLRKLVQQDLQRNLAQYSKVPLSFYLMKEIRAV